MGVGWSDSRFNSLRFRISAETKETATYAAEKKLSYVVTCSTVQQVVEMRVKPVYEGRGARAPRTPRGPPPRAAAAGPPEARLVVVVVVVAVVIVAVAVAAVAVVVVAVAAAAAAAAVVVVVVDVDVVS